jgi:hypothetical protein
MSMSLLLLQNHLNAEEYRSDGASSKSLPRNSAYASTSNFPAGNAIDNKDSFWSSSGHVTAGNTEWIYIDLGETVDVDRIRLTPRWKGLGFPKGFELQYSDDAISWITIPGHKYNNYTPPLGDAFIDSDQWFDIEGIIKARYIRLYATELGKDDYGNYYCQIAEFNAEPPRPLSNSPFFSSNGEQWDSRLNSMWRIYGSVSDGSNAVNKLGNEPAYWEWVTRKIIWSDESMYKSNLRDKIINAPITGNGYLWSWHNMESWPSGCRHQENNAKFILGAYHYATWEGLDFLEVIDPEITSGGDDISKGMSVKQKMDMAMNYMLNDLQGKDGIQIIDNGENDGTVYGRSSDYYDNYLMGNKMAYVTVYFYEALRVMAELENVLGNTSKALEYMELRKKVYTAFNDTFWDDDKKRYIGCIDRNGKVWDFGFTYLNTEAICYGLADTEKAEYIYDWLDGNRTIESDFSQGKKIYRWGFAPQTNTHPVESTGAPFWWWDWDGGIEVNRNAKYNEHQTNGGSILYQAYYDVLGRSKFLGADNAFDRFEAILEEFSYDELRRDPANTTGERWLVGCIGEFPESGLVPYTFLPAFIGIEASLTGLDIFPNLPSSMESAGVKPLHYRGNNYKVEVGNDQVRISTEKGSNNSLTGRIGNLLAKHNYWIENKDLTNNTVDYKDVMTDSMGVLLFDELMLGDRVITFFNPDSTNSAVQRNIDITSVKVFPNPMKNHCTINIQTPHSSIVSISVFDIQGILVYRKSYSLASGSHPLKWNCTDQYENRILSGFYLLKAEVSMDNDFYSSVEKIFISR